MNFMPTLYTHSGDFHSDELVAIALIQQFACPEGDTVDVVRTRHKERLAEALADPDVFVVDVGSQYDSDARNFDHHQAGGGDAWPDGLPKSSCGLVWSWLRDTGRLDHLGEAVCDRMEQELIRPIDAHDNGVDRWDFAPMFRMFNRTGGSERVVREQFEQALGLAQSLVTNQLHQVRSDLEAETYLRECWAQAQEDGERLVVVRRELGNRTAPTLLARLSGFEADLLLYPQSMSQKNSKWFIRALPEGEGAPDYRMRVPTELRGRQNVELDVGLSAPAKLVFVHNSGFLAQVEGSLEDAWAVAKWVAQHPENTSVPAQRSGTKPAIG